MKKENIIESSKTINSALSAITKVNGQVLYVLDKNKKVIGSLSDGDIRRFLLKDNSLETRVEKVCNKNFSFASEEDNNERIIKLLDKSGLQSVPILDRENKLLRVVNAEDLDFSIGIKSDVVSRAPARIGFAGGGSDLTTFFQDTKGAVLNCGLSKYARTQISLRTDKKYSFKSFDTNDEVIYDSWEEVKIDGQLDLLKCSLLVFEEVPPIHLSTKSDVPIGSGLGGSSALVVSIISALSRLLGKNYSAYALAEKAFLAERLIFSSAGGWQDQYASAFGGLNFMEFSFDSNTILPIRLNKETINLFQEWCFLIDSKITHDSSRVHTEIKKELDYKEKYNNIVHQCYVLRDMLMRGEIKNFATEMDKVWSIKKTLNENVTSSHLDSIYEKILSAGATGGKLLGAGGGGYFLALVDPLKRSEFLTSEHLKDFEIENVIFDLEGAISW